MFPTKQDFHSNLQVLFVFEQAEYHFYGLGYALFLAQVQQIKVH